MEAHIDTHKIHITPTSVHLQSNGKQGNLVVKSNVEKTLRKLADLAMRYTLTLPPGNVRLPTVVTSMLCAEYRVNRNYPARFWGGTKEEVEKRENV